MNNPRLSTLSSKDDIGSTSLKVGENSLLRPKSAGYSELHQKINTALTLIRKVDFAKPTKKLKSHKHILSPQIE
jgi:hypothetical protein